MEKEKVDKDVKEEKPETKPVYVGQVPTEFGYVYQTPEGVMNDREYLAWMGNLLLEVKQGLVG